MYQEEVINTKYGIYHYYWKAVVSNISITKWKLKVINRTIDGLFICGHQVESNIRNALNKLL